MNYYGMLQLEADTAARTALGAMENTGIGESLKTIAKVCTYILHPGRLALLLWNWTFNISYWVCLLIAVFSLFMVISGNNKFRKYIGGSIVTYFFINIINAFIGALI